MPKKPASNEDRIRRAVKRLEFEIESLEDVLAENGGYLDAIASTGPSVGTVRVIVRVRRADKPYKWAMSVLLNNQRIDGIDWEPYVKDHRGKAHDCTGWHRHIWSATAADKLKECLPSSFNPSTVREFLLRGFALLNIQWRVKEVARRGSQMRFDQSSLE